MKIILAYCCLFLLCSLKDNTSQITNISLKRYIEAKPYIKQDITKIIKYIGIVEPKQLISLHFLLAGKIDKCSVTEGQIIKTGQEICKLDKSAVNLEIQRATNNLNSAKKMSETNLYEKQKSLFEAGVIG